MSTEYRYLCVNGHHVVGDQDDLDTCTAVLPWPARPSSRSCGAQLSRFEGEAYAALEDENDRLYDALSFYADPDTYFAIGFFADPPCGEFMDDFSMADDRVEFAYERPMPGKRARAALASAVSAGADQ